jgi:hypothetical protein
MIFYLGAFLAQQRQKPGFSLQFLVPPAAVLRGFNTQRVQKLVSMGLLNLKGISRVIADYLSRHHSSLPASQTAISSEPLAFPCRYPKNQCNLRNQ